MYKHTAKERFLRYVQIDTQSDPDSTTIPSTAKQKDLSKLLVKELQEIGIKDAELDEFGYVYATIPANTTKKVPVICLCSHVDTAPDCSGAGVKPIVHSKYKGQDLVLPDDPTIVIREKEHEDLKHQHGNDIITASGTTLLGADNKAGVAAIMDAANILINNPSIKHGKIRILFTPDEEIGRGVNKVDMKKLGARFGYTIDGETAGSIEDETFSADGAVITINGVSAHPGFAKGKMEHAMKIAGKILAKLPDRLSPEHTEGRQGFIHPTFIEGGLEKATVKLILRDFTEGGLKRHARTLQKIVDKVLEGYPNSTADVKITEQYRNMGKVLRRYPQVVDNAVEALKRAGFEKPLKRAIRGGTDGSRLSFMGLPCPNIFAGEHAFHSKYEWVSVQDMEKAAETMVHLVQVWEERS
ncbi:MAG: peptidase T [Lewinellaceae bacterium]|nr:peptidase T [Saprospiraceae bacterium]MCB9317348.1 peptidase T [Lewinellaceae bacterium]MCB9333693.1 peptidase T [Lewinellaceae bacterium]